MLSAEAVVRVVDGSGVLRARVLRVLKGRGPGSTAGVGDLVRVAVVEARPGSAWRRGDLARGLVLRTRAPLRTRAGLRLRFGENALALVGDKGEVLGSRIRGPVPAERRHRGRGKLLSRAQAMV